mmetsp:Transcript_2420/g.9264  ORF Transcript_2420/g.9264 Transcript_2420/m.9264 type:complete len:207 (+) Transcript_2420:38-658(+)
MPSSASSRGLHVLNRRPRTSKRDPHLCVASHDRRRGGRVVPREVGAPALRFERGGFREDRLLLARRVGLEFRRQRVRLGSRRRGEQSHGEQAGVGRVADRDRRDGDAARHLDDRVERVDARERRGLDLGWHRPHFGSALGISARKDRLPSRRGSHTRERGALCRDITSAAQDRSSEVVVQWGGHLIGIMTASQRKVRSPARSPARR